jgi:signal transduction histidine kinase
VLIVVVVRTDLVGWRGAPPRAVSVDKGVAVLLVVAAAVGAIASGRYPPPWRVLGVLVAAGLGVLVWRRRRPLLVAAVVGATAVAETSLTTNRVVSPLMVSVMVAAYSLGAYSDGRSSAVGLALGVATVAGAHAAAAPAGYSAASSLVFFCVVLILVPFCAGRIVASRRALASLLDEATVRLREATTNTALELAADRAELGRSLELTLAGLDDMADHAEVATLGQVTAIEAISRHTLGDVRRLLVDLRSDGEPILPPTPLGELRLRVEAALAADPGVETGEAVVPHLWTLPSARSVDRVLGALAVIYATAMVATTLSHPRPGPAWLSVTLAATIGAVVAGLRRAPLAIAVAAVAAAVAYSATAHPLDPLSGLQPAACLVLAPLALGAWQRARVRQAVGLCCCLGAIPAVVLLDASAHIHPGSVAPAPVLVVGFFTIGAVLQSRSRMVAEVAGAALLADTARRAQATVAVRAERTRIARELHDALAHSLTAIVLQATAARRVWDTNPELAREHAASLRATLADTTGELRQLVASLASGTEGDVNIADIGVLADRARATGMDVALSVHGPRSPPRGETERTALRIVQEALTNAARHAPGSRVTVQIDHRGPELKLLVINTAPATPPWQIAGAGHGVEGMRERARSCGGHLDVGPTRDGGFFVAACLPKRPRS